MTEEFGSTIDDTLENKKTSKFRKTEFLNLTPGEHKIRILDPMEVKKYTHYIGFAYVECLGETCPICANNKRILYEHPQDYRDVKGWNPRRARFYINVLDKTPTRVCPKCGTEKQDATLMCPACGTQLADPTPLNKVKVLSSGKELMEDLKIQSKAVRNEQDERIDIRMYDWILDVRGAGRDKKVNAVHKWYPGKEALENLGEQQTFDLDNVTVKLEPDEMLEVFNGTSLKDIFAVRRAKKQVLNSADLNTTVEDINTEISDEVDSLFKM